MATMFPNKDFEGFHVQNVWLPDGKSLDHEFLSQCAIIAQSREFDPEVEGGIGSGWSLLVIFPHERTPEQEANVASAQARAMMETRDMSMGFVPGGLSAQ